MESLISLKVDEEKDRDLNHLADQLLSQPYYHLTENVGKKFRTKLVEMLNFSFGVPKSTMDNISNSFEEIHNSILLIDDIQDYTTLRRGSPTAHTIFGIARTISSFDLILRNIEMNYPQIHKDSNIVISTMYSSLKGQIMEIFWRDNFICPSEEEYIDMVLKKTGSTFINIFEAYKQYGIENSDGLKSIVMHMGIYFQIRDDLLNLTSTSYQESKGFCEDLTEGKFSFPVIHAIKSRPDDFRVLNILKLRTLDIEIKKQCLKLLEEFGSIEYTKCKLEYYYNIIKEEIIKADLIVPFQILKNTYFKKYI